MIMNIFHTITVVCAYCKKTIGTKDGEGVSGTSHGICSVCMEQMSHAIHKTRRTHNILWMVKAHARKS